ERVKLKPIYINLAIDTLYLVSSDHQQSNPFAEFIQRFPDATSINSLALHIIPDQRVFRGLYRNHRLLDGSIGIPNLIKDLKELIIVARPGSESICHSRNEGMIRLSEDNVGWIPEESYGKLWKQWGWDSWNAVTSHVLNEMVQSFATVSKPRPSSIWFAKLGVVLET